MGAGWDFPTRTKSAPDPHPTHDPAQVFTQHLIVTIVSGVVYRSETLKEKANPNPNIHPSSPPMAQSIPSGKCMSKLTERAKAALEEQHKTSKKCKKDDQNTEAVPKKVCSDPQTDITSNGSLPSSPAPSMNKGQQPTVADMDDEYDEVIRERREQWGGNMQLKAHKSCKATVEDAEDESDGVERGRSTTTVQTPEPETDDEQSVFIL